MARPNRQRLSFVPVFTADAVRRALERLQREAYGVSQRELRGHRHAGRITRRAFAGTARAALGRGFGCAWERMSLKLQQERLGAEQTHPHRIEPGGGAGTSPETIRAEGSTDESQDPRHFGHAKEGRTVRQVMLGVVQTEAGLPIHNEVFAGNTGETTTLVPTIDHGRRLRRAPPRPERLRHRRQRPNLRLVRQRRQPEPYALPDPPA
jgi:hypothetical protein